MGVGKYDPSSVNAIHDDACRRMVRLFIVGTFHTVRIGTFEVLCSIKGRDPIYVKWVEGERKGKEQTLSSQTQAGILQNIRIASQEVSSE